MSHEWLTSKKLQEESHEELVSRKLNLSIKSRKELSGERSEGKKNSREERIKDERTGRLWGGRGVAKETCGKGNSKPGGG